MDCQPACPLCSQESRTNRVIHGYPIHECQSCRHLFYQPPEPDTHVAQHYCDDYFLGSAQGYLDYPSEEAIQRRSARNYVNIIGQHWDRAPGRMLDIGAACGFFLKEFKDACWQVQGIEPNRWMQRLGNEKFGVNITTQSIDQWPESQTFDLVLMVQVISHLLHPINVLQQIYQRMQPEALLLIETWDRTSWAARLAGNRWHEFNPPTVVHWFTRCGLANCVESIGFQPIAQGRPHKSIQIGRAIQMLRHSSNNSTMTKALTWPLQCVPSEWTAPYFLDDAFWILFRKR